jgi:hypothetical protein
MRIDDWFLAAGERDNRHSAIDRRHDGVPWTEGNLAEILIDGSEYFTRLYSLLLSAAPGDSVYLTGLEGDADERLADPGTEGGTVLGDLVKQGVRVRALAWRSHGASFAEEKNSTDRLLGKIVPVGTCHRGRGDVRRLRSVVRHSPITQHQDNLCRNRRSPRGPHRRHTRATRRALAHRRDRRAHSRVGVVRYLLVRVRRTLPTLRRSRRDRGASCGAAARRRHRLAPDSPQRTASGTQLERGRSGKTRPKTSGASCAAETPSTSRPTVSLEVPPAMALDLPETGRAVVPRLRCASRPVQRGSPSASSSPTRAAAC